MEATRASVTVSAVGHAVGIVESGASSSSSPLQTSARALLTRKPLSCWGLSSSSGSCAGLVTSRLSSFCYNALAGKVAQAESGRKRYRGVVTMGVETVAGGYANALAELAQNTDNLEPINKDIESFGQILSNNPELYDFLVNPVVGDEKKKSILKTLSDDGQFNPYTLNFLYILIDKKRINLINDVVKEFSTIYYDLSDSQLAVVSSAVKIEDAQLNLIAKKIQSLSGKKVRISNIIDASLIAGFVVKYGKDGSRFVDMSVKGQLDRLAQQFEYAEKAQAF